MRSLLAGCLLAMPVVVQAQEPVDYQVVHEIKDEAFKNSKISEDMFYLADLHGPRLTASANYRAAADWAVGRLKEFGIQNAALESWGTFGRGWSLTHFQMAMVEPSYTPLPGVVKAWSTSTEGLVRGPVVIAPLNVPREERFNIDRLQAAIATYKTTWAGKLKGQVVLFDPRRPLALPGKANSERYDDKGLADIAVAPDPVEAAKVELPLKSMPADYESRFKIMMGLPPGALDDFYDRLGAVRDQVASFLHDEGVLAVLTTDTRGEGSITFAEAGGPYKADGIVPAPTVVLPPEPYNRLWRLVDKKVPVKVEVEIGTKFDPPADGFNVVGEIPGSNPKKKDEVVMVGAHLDSWQGGTGATDNGAGSVVALEVMRILKAIGRPMDRTVRIGLWSGEEQGLLGSKGYVKTHFGDPKTMVLKPEQAKFSGYFNLDNGTGKVRGVYLQGNDMMRPIFEGWLLPFRDEGVTTITIRNTGGTDHQSFDAVGLPGFQFIQDPLDYSTRTHHSNLDTADHIQPADLMQASAVLATCVYEAAVRRDLLPRKPLPKPAPTK